MVINDILSAYNVGISQLEYYCHNFLKNDVNKISLRQLRSDSAHLKKTPRQEEFLWSFHQILNGPIKPGWKFFPRPPTIFFPLRCYIFYDGDCCFTVTSWKWWIVLSELWTEETVTRCNFTWSNLLRLTLDGQRGRNISSYNSYEKKYK